MATNEDLAQMIQRKDDKDGALILQLFEQNKGMIWKVISRYSPYAEIEDLEQESFIALCNAVNNYDMEKGLFLNYLVPWIFQACHRYVENNCSAIRIPSNERQYLIKYKRLVDSCLQAWGRVPTDIEVICMMDIKPEKLDAIKKSLSIERCRSFSEPLTEDSESLELIDSIPDTEIMEETVIDKIYREELSDILWSLVDLLPQKSADILKRYYKNGETQTEIALSTGISNSSVSVYLKNAIEQMRRSEKINELKSIISDQDQSAYDLGLKRVGVNSFNRTHISSTEYAAFRIDEIRRREDESKNRVLQMFSGLNTVC